MAASSKKHQTAATMNVKSLYRYQHYKPDRLTSILTGIIYCASPSDFNDPWDCRPCFNTAELDNPQALEKHIQWLDRADREHHPESEEEHCRRVERLRAEPELVKRVIARVSDGIVADIDRLYGVCCFSTRSDCTLMWSHYAGNHKGVCLEFAADNDVLGSALKVEYFYRYPFFELADDGLEQNLLPLISKSNVWRYEDEYRLVAQERRFAGNLETLMMDDHKVPLPPQALRSVIVGCLVPGETCHEIRTLIAQYNPDVEIKRALRLPDRYGLDITKL